MADSASDLKPVYTKVQLISDYRFLHDAYYGTGGFKNGDYLVPHLRTDSDQFEEMKGLAYYANYVKPIVNSHISPIFSKAKKWQVDPLYDGDIYLEAFLSNADGLGHPLERVTKRAARMAKLYAVCFAVVDNYAPEQLADNAGDNIANRKFPYTIIVPASSVSSWVIDVRGKFLRFTYLESVQGNTKRYKTWTPDEWFLSNDKGVRVPGDAGAGGANPLGEVPVQSLYAFDREELEDVLPLSEFYGIARLNHRIFNLDAEITELSRSQAFSIFCYPGQPASLVHSPRSAVGFSGTTSPSFVSPDAAQLQTLLSDRADLVSEMYRQAQLTHLHQGESTNASGLAKSYDLEITAQALRDFTSNIEQFEEGIVQLFGLWLKQSYGYDVTYPRDYSLEDVAVVLQESLSALDIDFGTAGNAEVRKRAARSYFNDDNQAYEVAVQSISASVSDTNHGGVEGDPDGDQSADQQVDQGGSSSEGDGNSSGDNTGVSQ